MGFIEITIKIEQFTLKIENQRFPLNSFKTERKTNI